MNETQNYTIAEEFTLPSKGKIYDKKINPTVKLRSMTARDEMKRLSPSATPLKSLAEIIDGCIVSEKLPISVYDLATSDYEFLLHKLRTVTYGSNYKVYLTCPECGEDVETTFDLDSLEIKEFDQSEFTELSTFELPVSKHIITLKYQTPHSMEVIEARAKEMKRKMKGADRDFEVFALLNYVIDTVDGNKLPPFELENFIDRLPARDMNKIRNNVEKLSSCFGIDTKFTVTCPKCKEDIDTFFRFGSEFFRPTED